MKSIRGTASTVSGTSRWETMTPMSQNMETVKARPRTNEMGSRRADKVVCPRAFARCHGTFPESGREAYDPRA